MKTELVSSKTFYKTLAELNDLNVEVTLVVCTKVNLKKSSPYYGVRKRATVKALLNYNYVEQMRRLDQEFEPSEDGAAWGERVEGTPLIEHRENRYLDCWIVESLGHSYYWPETGKAASTLKVEAELPDKNGDSKVRRYKLESVTSYELDGVLYLPAS